MCIITIIIFGSSCSTIIIIIIITSIFLCYCLEGIADTENETKIEDNIRWALDMGLAILIYCSFFLNIGSIVSWLQVLLMAADEVLVGG